MSRKDVLNMLDNRDDPEVDAAIKAYMQQQYQSAGKGGAAAPAPAAAELELTASLEKKYVAAQIVEHGIQVRFQPLARATAKPSTRT